MIEPKILAQFNLRLSDINVSTQKSNRKTNDEIEKRIKRKWNEILIDAKKNGKLAYENEFTYRLNNFTFDNNKLSIELGQTPFSVRYTLSKFEDIKSLQQEYWSKGVFIGGLVKTTDDYFVFGKKSNSNLSSTNFNKIERIDPVGGALDQKIEEENNYLELILKNELKEELGIEDNNINEIRALGILLSRTSFVGIQCLTKLNLTRNEVYNRFKTQSDDEFKDLVFIENDEIHEFLLNLEDYRPLLSDLLTNYYANNPKNSN